MIGQGLPPRPQSGAGSPGAAPRGYDQNEFAPAECGRDFPRPQRRRQPDEERRLLRQVEADFHGADRRPPAGEVGKTSPGAPEREPDPPTRLYRD